MKTYNILANKWRPQTFKDFVEQTHIVNSIKNILKSKKIHNCYIFYGPKGTGKTTLARLFSKGLLCMQGINYNPCQICNNCKAIIKGNCLDFIEIDGASHTKVDEIRNLLSNLPYLPSQSKYKIYLIDEFHMLSSHSFNALLKTLEEPPLHIKFILITTQIEKIPSTILSRSILFNLQLISNYAILLQLKKILIKENIKITLPALNLISIESQGSLRDAITLTEHAILLNQNKLKPITLKHINKILCRINPLQIICFLKVILDNNIKQLFCFIYLLDIKYNINWLHFINDLIIINHKILLINIIKNKYKNKINNLIQIILKQDIILSKYQKKKIIYIAFKTKYQKLQRVYKILTNFNNELINNNFISRFVIEKIFLKIILINNIN